MKKFLVCLLSLSLIAAPALASAETNVVASFYPIYAIAANLLRGADDATLSCLAAPSTGCLHDKALLPSDMRALSAADIMLINGAGMEGYLESVIAQFPELAIADASSGIALLPASGHDELGEPGDHADHDHGEYNAHIWLDALRAAKMTENIAAGLSEAMPESADIIAQNRDEYISRLTALDAEIKLALAPYAGREIVTLHAAFDYFAEAYGLSVIFSITDDPESPLSAGEMSELCERIVGAGLPPLLAETAYSASAAEVLSSETGAKVYTLDAATTGELGQAALTAYESAMRKNAETLIAALGE